MSADGNQLGHSSLPRSNEIVNFISRFAPVALDELRRKHPSESLLLTPSEMMGGESANDDSATLGRLAALRDAANSALAIAQQQCERQVINLAKTLKVAFNLQMVSQILSAASGVGVIITLSHTNHIISYVLASCAVITSVFSVISQSVIGSKGTGDLTASGRYAKLVSEGFRAKQLQIEIAMYANLTVSDIVTLKPLITAANNLCDEVNSLVSVIQ